MTKWELTTRPWRFWWCAAIAGWAVTHFGWLVLLPIVLISVDVRLKR